MMILNVLRRVALLLAAVHIIPVSCGIGLTPWQFFVGNGEDSVKVIPISFQPDHGLKLREKFERKHGIRGEKLVDSFGHGSEVEGFGLTYQRTAVRNVKTCTSV